jgi:hypothetical protein
MRAKPFLEAGFLVVAPIGAVLLFDISLINQDRYVDPWFYTGYGQLFPRMVEIYGWPYYAVRFPVILGTWVLTSVLPPFEGYVAFRFLILLACGIPLYLFARGTYGVEAAVVGYAFLLCNPLLSRILLWDLTTFLAIPMVLAGMACWLLPAGPYRVARVLAGVAFLCALASHIFTVTAIGLFMLIQMALSLRSPADRRDLRLDLVAAAIGGCIAAGLGIIGYHWLVGSFDLNVLYRQQVVAIGTGNDYSRSHSRPFVEWGTRQLHVYVPPILLFAGLALLGRRLFAVSVASRVVWFALVYVGFFIVYRFYLGHFIIETFYYFGHVTVVAYLLVPVVVGELASREGPNERRVTFAFLGGLLVYPLAYRFLFSTMEQLHRAIRGNVPALVTIAAAFTLWLLVAAWGKGGWIARVVLATTVVLLVQTATFSHPTHGYVFGRIDRQREAAVFEAAMTFIDITRRYDRRGERILTWWPADQHSLRSIAFTMLGYSLGPPFGTPGLPRVGDYEMRRLASPLNRYVLLMAERESQISSGRSALADAGIKLRDVASRELGGQGYRARALLVEIIR